MKSNDDKGYFLVMAVIVGCMIIGLLAWSDSRSKECEEKGGMLINTPTGPQCAKLEKVK